MTDSKAGIDLGAYLHRIGYEGPRVASIDTLRQLHYLHPKAIAFENLSPLLHQAVPLDAASLEAKLVHGGRGGYCFEHNLLFAHALRAMGFRVQGLAARVLWNRPATTLTSRGHMLLRVDFDAQCMICDVGFGGMTLTGPLELIACEKQATPHESFRLQPMHDGYRMEVLVEDEWKPLYRFTLEENFQCDYEVTNYYLSTNPDSHFRRGLMVARSWEEGRYTLSNNRLTMRTTDGQAEKRELESIDEILDTLREKFLITIPDVAALEAAILREGLLAAPEKVTSSPAGNA